MDISKLLGPQGMKVLKVFGIALLVLVGVSILLASLNSARNSGLSVSDMGTPMAPSFYGESDDAYAPSLSARNVAVTRPTEEYIPGDDSEAYEVKEYNARIETRNLSEDCGAVRALKARQDVVFERASENERSCSFTFKVKQGSVEEVLSSLKALDPRELTETAYTIKRQVTDYTSEIQILENQLASYDKTLVEAVASYESITALATETGNADALAKVIQSKLTIIERLTQLRVQTVGELDRMNRSKAEALDRLEYTYFSVYIYENKFIDGTSLTDSWKAAVKRFVEETNRLLQDISIGVVSFLLLIVKFALYAVIVIVAARFGLTFVKRVWMEENRAGLSDSL
jgi:hypothetical protein